MIKCIFILGKCFNPRKTLAFDMLHCMEGIVCALSNWLFQHYVSTLGGY